MRSQQLRGLEKFLPVQSAAFKRNKRNAVVEHLVATGALIRQSFRTTGGHLLAEEKKLFYIRIPKSANTSCSWALLKSNFPDLPESITSAQVNFLTDCWLQRALPPAHKTLTGFTLVRHPLHRLVSVYRDFFERNTPHHIYNGYLLNLLPPTLLFDEFVDRISRIPDRLKDQHFRPQHLFLDYYRKAGIPVKVFRLEQPDEWRNFLKPFGIEPGHFNKAPEPYDYRAYYSSRSLAIVSKMYAPDFSLFNYDHLVK